MRVTGFAPAREKSLDDLDDWMSPCEDDCDGTSRKARFLHGLLATDVHAAFASRDSSCRAAGGTAPSADVLNLLAAFAKSGSWGRALTQTVA
jgi:hypothetical protein